jgi:hypothetical protein
MARKASTPERPVSAVDVAAQLLEEAVARERVTQEQQIQVGTQSAESEARALIRRVFMWHQAFAEDVRTPMFPTAWQRSTPLFLTFEGRLLRYFSHQGSTPSFLVGEPGLGKSSVSTRIAEMFSQLQEYRNYFMHSALDLGWMAQWSVLTPLVLILIAHDSRDPGPSPKWFDRAVDDLRSRHEVHQWWEQAIAKLAQLNPSASTKRLIRIKFTYDEPTEIRPRNLPEGK